MTRSRLQSEPLHPSFIRFSQFIPADVPDDITACVCESHSFLHLPPSLSFAAAEENFNQLNRPFHKSDGGLWGCFTELFLACGNWLGEVQPAERKGHLSNEFSCCALMKLFSFFPVWKLLLKCIIFGWITFFSNFIWVWVVKTCLIVISVHTQNFPSEICNKKVYDETDADK